MGNYRREQAPVESHSYPPDLIHSLPRQRTPHPSETPGNFLETHSADNQPATDTFGITPSVVCWPSVAPEKTHHLSTRPRRHHKAIAVTAAGALLAAGLAAIPSANKPAKKAARPTPVLAQPSHLVPNATPGQVGPCYSVNTTLPKVKSIPSILNVELQYGLPYGQSPFTDPAVINKVEPALVEITTNPLPGMKEKGTGFIVTDDSGEQIVITAAHVLGDLSTSGITITAANGQSTHPIGGCYLYGKSGEKPHKPEVTPDESGYEDVDAAGLILSSPLTSKPLSVADAPPEAGAVVNLVNYQGDFGPQNSLFGDPLAGAPAAYPGIVAPSWPNDPEIQVVTGANTAFGSSITKEEYDASRGQAGSSGGPVVYQNKVVGISVAGTRNKDYLSYNQLQNIYGMHFSGVTYGASSGFEPRGVVTEPEKVIHAVQNASKVLMQRIRTTPSCPKSCYNVTNGSKNQATSTRRPKDSHPASRQSGRGLPRKQPSPRAHSR